MAGMRTSTSTSTSSSSALYFKFDLCQSCLQVINESNLHVLEQLLQHKVVTLIGIDTENRPNRRRGQCNPVSILQLAFRTVTGYEHVLIIDLLALQKHPTKAMKCNDLLLPLFSNASIFKLGQGLIGDFKMLTKSYPLMTAFHTCNGILDTSGFMKRLFPELKREYSLKFLTNFFLHFDLDKSQQMSDWARRPLTVKQVHYAACDALVLLRLYDVMAYFLTERQQGNNNSSSSLVDLSELTNGTEVRTTDFTFPKFEIKSVLVRYAFDTLKPVPAAKRSVDEIAAFEKKVELDCNFDFEVSATSGGKMLELSQNKKRVVVNSRAVLVVPPTAVLPNKGARSICSSTEVIIFPKPDSASSAKIGLDDSSSGTISISDAGTDIEVESLTNSSVDCELLSGVESPSLSSVTDRSVSAGAYVDLYRPLKKQRQAWSPAHRQQRLYF
jgi:hypothetical protein